MIERMGFELFVVSAGGLALLVGLAVTVWSLLRALVRDEEVTRLRDRLRDVMAERDALRRELGHSAPARRVG